MTATRVSDTKIIADFGAVGLGAHTININNGLNVATSTATMRVIAAGTYAYKAIPITEGQLREPFVYDPLNENAYVNSQSSAQMLRIPIGSSVAQPVGGTRNLGIAANGVDFLTAKNAIVTSRANNGDAAIAADDRLKTRERVRAEPARHRSGDQIDRERLI